MAAPPPVVSIVIPTFNRGDLTVKCIQSIYKNTRGVAFETIIVDNASSDGTRDFLQKVGHIVRTILNPENRGFAHACNQGAVAAKGRFVLFLNNDTEVHPGWLSPLVEIASADPRVGMVGPRLIYPDGTLQHVGVGFRWGAPNPIQPYHLHAGESATAAGLVERDHVALTAACVLIPRALFLEMRGFDEAYINGYEDIDLCFRMGERGLRMVYTPRGTVTHHESKSPGRLLAAQHNINLLHARWLGRFTSFTAPTYDGQPSVVQPDRAPITFIVIAQQDLNTVVPALELLLRAAGPADEILVHVRPSTDVTAAAVEGVVRRHSHRLKMVASTVDLGVNGVLGALSTTHAHWLVCTPGVLLDAGSVAALVAAGAERVVAPMEPGLPALPAGPAPVSYGSVLCGPRHLFLTALSGPPQADLLALSAALAAAGAPVNILAEVDVQPILDRPTATRVARSAQAALAHLAAERVRAATGLSTVPAAVGAGIPLQQGLVSIILLALDNHDLTAECLESVYAHTHHPFELVLVDNASVEDIAGLAARLQARHGNVVYLRNEENQGFAYGVNQGLAAAKGEHLLLLNNDVVVPDGWLSQLLAAYDADPAVALVGPRSNKCAGVQLLKTVGYANTAELGPWAAAWRRGSLGGIQPHIRLIGLCVLFKRAVLDRIGGMDTIFGLGNFEDDDFSLRAARAGFVAVIAQGCFIHHHGSATFRSLGIDFGALMAANWELFAHKWQEDVRNLGRYDPAALVNRRAFDPAWDHIPLDFGAIYHPAAPPLDLGVARPLLFVPDFGAGDWVAALSTLLDRAAGRPVVVRLEPPLPSLAEERRAAVLRAANGRALIFSEHSIPAAARGGLYTAAAALITCPGPRERFVAREARACGLSIYTAADLPGAP